MNRMLQRTDVKRADYRTEPGEAMWDTNFSPEFWWQKKSRLGRWWWYQIVIFYGERRGELTEVYQLKDLSLGTDLAPSQKLSRKRTSARPRKVCQLLLAKIAQWNLHIEREFASAKELLEKVGEKTAGKDCCPPVLLVGVQQHLDDGLGEPLVWSTEVLVTA